MFTQDQATILDALGNDVRRAIATQLRAGESTVGELANVFDISRPAISRHIKILTEAGLTVAHQRGTATIVSLNKPAWQELQAIYSQFWRETLTSFADYTNAPNQEN